MMAAAQDQPPRHGVIGKLRHVRAARGNHHRQVEMPAEPDGGHAVWVEIMRVDGVETMPLRQQPFQGGAGGGIEKVGRGGHADARDGREPRVMHIQPGPAFMRWCGGVSRPGAKARVPAGKPRHRRQHTGCDATAGDQMPQPVFHENPVVGRRRVGI
jgi:hypothetical protein